MAADASAFSSSSRSSFSVSDDADEYSAVLSQSSRAALSAAAAAAAAARGLAVLPAYSPTRRRDSISMTDDSGGSAKRTLRWRADPGPWCRPPGGPGTVLLVGRL